MKIMKYKTSRGWRNNNPLNIKKGEPWQGLCQEQNDKVFCQFINKTWGYRAAAKCLKSYYRYVTQDRQGRLTWDVPFIITRWAPQSENDSLAYCRRVLELMGREPDNYRLAPLYSPNGKYQIKLLAAAMTCVECGCPMSAVPVRELNAGFTLAGIGGAPLEPLSN